MSKGGLTDGELWDRRRGLRGSHSHSGGGGGASTRLTALTAIPRWGIGPRSRKGQRDHIVHFLSESIPGVVGLDAPPGREVLGVHDEVRTRAT